MDKGDESSSICSTSASVTNISNSSRNMFLNQVNKNSHKIAKSIRKPLSVPNPAAASSSIIPVTDPNPDNSGLGQTMPQSQPPPVYNINKDDFRDVVQKLTGSPAHERLPAPRPPPVTHPRPPSSRLQRIRPPPLAQISNRPNQITPFLNRPQNDAGHRPPAHAQPLPPLPSVHTAAESPISAYMRFFHHSAAPPLWDGVAPIGGPPPDSMLPQNEFGQRPPPPLSPLQPSESPTSAYIRFFQSSALSSSSASPQPPLVQPSSQPPLTSSDAFPSLFPRMPLSPLPFGCIPSPRSPYGKMSPGFLFQSTCQFGFPHLPLSPTLPVPSPRWKGM
ncbi:hypothetical protein OROGR_026169 [Orobanche gracilis]